jgi:3-isopropylmalate/(R)-2-methylmalate dehydratase small subunit
MTKERIISTVTGTGIPVRGNDIDTDRIIPARYLREITFENLGPHAFEDDRRQLDGQHPFDDQRFDGARVLVVNRNFGSGSSREHAPQALMRHGIATIVGESFAEIFFGNCTIIGVPCLTLSPEHIESLQSLVEEAPDTVLSVDVWTGAISAGHATYQAKMPETIQRAFTSGAWDALATLLEADHEITDIRNRLPYVSGWESH